MKSQLINWFVSQPLFIQALCPDLEWEVEYIILKERAVVCILELGIDEITLVLQATAPCAGMWTDLAEWLISQFAVRSQFIHTYGIQAKEDKSPAGYTVAYHYGAHNFYLALAYHPDHARMGIVVKLSAQALDYYTEHSGMKLYQLLQIAKDDSYTMRLSRVDLTADYIDEAIDVTAIYHGLNAHSIGIYDRYEGRAPDEPIYKRRNLEYRGFCVADTVPTIYIGTVKSDVQLRIYDKKREQLERKGTKMAKAIACTDWVRWECILKSDYAHQFTDALSLITSDIEFGNLIASVIVQKFRFMLVYDGNVDVETDYTQMLIDCIINSNFRLKSASTKNYELANSIAHIYNGSGLLSTAYKIKDIWGDTAAWDFMAHTYDLLADFEPNDDCQYWLMRNANDYKSNYPTWADFTRDNLPQIYYDKKQQKGLRKVEF